MRQAFRLAVCACLWLAATAWAGTTLEASGGVGAEGWQSVSHGTATVLVPQHRLLPWGREVAVKADAAVRLAAAFWEVPAPHVHVVIDDLDERFNAFVDPLVGPVIHLRTRGPVSGEVGLDAPDPLLLLLVHEAIHAIHFGARPGSVPAGTGILAADVPWPPPAWLLEGVAVWAESRLLPGRGGRLDDAEARGILRTLAWHGPWPGLSDASLVTHDAWPAGDVRYLLGGAFVERLVDRHGGEALRDALRRFETRAPWSGFRESWNAVTGSDLEEEWEALRADLRAEAAERVTSEPDILVAGTSPARSLDGTRLAWRDGDRVRVADWSDATGPAAGGEARSYPVRGTPDRLAWWGVGRLVYARVVATPHARLRELVSLDLHTGREHVLTRGARAYSPVPAPGNCLLFVRDVADEGSTLRRWCHGGPAAGVGVWAPPARERIVGLAASPSGRIAALLWRAGSTRLVELRLAATSAGEVVVAGVVPLPSPPGALRDPVWDGEEALLVRSDADGSAFESWRVPLRSGVPHRLTATLGGVVAHAPGLVSVPRRDGPGLALVASVRAPARAPGGRPERTEDGPAATAAPAGIPSPGPAPAPAGSRVAAPSGVPPAARRYRPVVEMRPAGWYPFASPAGGVGIAVAGAEPTGTAGGELRLGVSTRARGPLGPVWLGARLVLGDAALLPMPRRAAPVTVRIGVGVVPYRPHRSGYEALVPRFDLSVAPVLSVRPALRARLDLSLLALDGDGLRLSGRAALAGSDGRADAWGVPLVGWASSATLVADPLPGSAISWGGWLDASGWLPVPSLGSARAAGSLRAGWRPPPAVPTGAWGDLAAGGVAALEWTVPVRLRVADGRWAWERLRLGPGLRVQFADRPGGADASVGAEFQVSADLVLGYGAPATVTLAAGTMTGAGTGGSWVRLTLPGLP